jgi:hypothetical protein
MVLLGVVIGKCEMPSTDISQENAAFSIVYLYFYFNTLNKGLNLSLLF